MDFQESQHDYAVATDTVRCWLEDWSREGRDLARATWYSIDENTPQDQLPEHGARLLVEDGEGRVYYAVYSGYLNFLVHKSPAATGRWPSFHRTSTGFVKKFLILLPPAVKY